MAKRSIKTKSKLSRPGGLATVALLALAGIVAVVLVRAGGAGPQTIPVNVSVRNDGNAKSETIKTLKKGSNYRVCFTLENTQSELAPDPQVTLSASTSVGGLIAAIPTSTSKAVAMNSTYYDPVETCLDKMLLTQSGHISYGITLRKGGNVQVHSITFKEQGSQGGGAPETVTTTLNWMLNPAPIRGIVKFNNLALLKKGFTVRSCFLATGKGEAIFKMGTKSEPGISATNRIKIGSAKQFCTKPTFTPKFADLMYEVYAMPGADFKLDTITLQTVDDRAPTIPTGLRAQEVVGRGAKLTWSKSTDNVGVTGYNIYRQIGRGKVEQIGKTNKLTFTDPAPGSEVTIYYVAAYDAAGNISGKSPRAIYTDRRDVDRDRTKEDSTRVQ